MPGETVLVVETFLTLQGVSALAGCNRFLLGIFCEQLRAEIAERQLRAQLFQVECEVEEHWWSNQPVSYLEDSDFEVFGWSD